MRCAVCWLMLNTIPRLPPGSCRKKAVLVNFPESGLSVAQPEAADSAASTPSLEPQDGEVWYLAFGSNMSPKVKTLCLDIKLARHFFKC